MNTLQYRDLAKLLDLASVALVELADLVDGQ